MTRRVSKTAVSIAPRRRAGRPSRQEAGQLTEHILETASALLLAHGYGATTIEEIARRAGISKRTFYDRFDDKAALMSAVVTRLIDSLRPPPYVALLEGKNLEQILLHLAQLILHAALTPRALRLHRLIVAESERFPELAAVVAKAGGRQEAVSLISQLLLREAPHPQFDATSAAFAAQQFLQMVVSTPQMRALGLGSPMNAAELEAWAQRSVALFVDGVLRLSST